ncbi:MAG: DUF2970 domain-containing protein [Oleiphilaceae bacterium]|nr:DUF2970 domain-containing protein [Oleiphilaceae bacterium]
MEPTESKRQQRDPEADQAEMTLWQTFQSVLWALLGVQKRSNAKRDFTKGKASHFIVLGILCGVAFVITLIFVVRLILQHATS